MRSASVNLTLRGIVISFNNRASKGDTVIVDRGAISDEQHRWGNSHQGDRVEERRGVKSSK